LRGVARANLGRWLAVARDVEPLAAVVLRQDLTHPLWGEDLTGKQGAEILE
jgi:hypothetical protein